MTGRLAAAQTGGFMANEKFDQQKDNQQRPNPEQQQQQGKDKAQPEKPVQKPK